MSCAKFESDKATADTAYDNSLASASAGLAAANTAYFAAYQEFLSGGLATAPLDNRAAASKAFNIAVGQAGVTRAGAIGTAEVTEAGSLGTAESQWATATGTDETTLAGQLGPAADSLAATLAADDKTFVTSLTAAATTAAEGLATASQTFTTTSDSQIESTQETLGTNEVTAATAIATAEAKYAYDVASDDADAAYRVSGASDANYWQWQYDLAYKGWIESLALNAPKKKRG